VRKHGLDFFVSLKHIQMTL